MAWTNFLLLLPESPNKHRYQATGGFDAAIPYSVEQDSPFPNQDLEEVTKRALALSFPSFPPAAARSFTEG